MRGTPGRHRRGTPGTVWCAAFPAVAATLARPEIARRGLVERLLATARHVHPLRSPRLARAGGLGPSTALA